MMKMLKWDNKTGRLAVGEQNVQKLGRSTSIFIYMEFIKQWIKLGISPVKHSVILCTFVQASITL